MMRQPARRTSTRLSVLTRLAACAALAVATVALGHEDDPKALEKHKPVYGPVWRAADGGVAVDTFAASGVALKAWFPVNNFDQQGQANTSGNDCWGYVSPSGREYAIIGLSNGTGFVDITDPAASTIVGFVVGPTSLWRNVKTYQHYCYAVSEGGGGIQVMDLANIDQGQIAVLPSVTTGGSTATHTMIINTQTGYLYRMGGGSNGVRIYSLTNPAAPVFVAQWQNKYTHDGFVLSYNDGPYAGKEIFFACGGLNNGYSNTGLDIIDVTNKSNLQVLSSFTYPQAAYCHQAWITEDRKHIYITDVIDEANFGVLNMGRIVNVENLSAPALVGTFTSGLVSVDHNEYVHGDLLFCSNYKTGLRVYDVSDQPQPQPVAWFDTYPEADATGYAGLWSNYPYFPSGTIIGSDIERGLFVWRLEPPVASFGYPEGLPTYINPQGGATLDVSITPQPGQSIVAGSATLTVRIGSGTPTNYSLQSLGKDLYRATFPAFDCGTAFTYSFSVTGASGVVTSDPPGGHAAIAALGEPVAFSDTLEAGTTGWVGGLAGDTATSGKWVWGDPVGTSAQPEDDHTPDGTKCWVTGQGTAGGAAGDADVDGGITTLLSPIIDCTTMNDPIISYWRWYSNNQGSNPGSDVFPISISNDGGATWVVLENVTDNAGAWVKKSWRVSDFVAPTSTVRLKFVARDDAPSSLVEAAIDDLAVTSYDCPAGVLGDLDGDGSVGATDLALLLGQWGTEGSADLDGNGSVGASDLAILLGAWG